MARWSYAEQVVFAQRLTAIQKRIQEIQNDPRIPDQFKQQGLSVLRGREEALKAGHTEPETGVR